MKKNLGNRIMSLVLTIVMVLSCLSGTALPVFAVESTSGTCGANLTWEFNESTGTLSITGTGAMTDYESDEDVPWDEIRDDITQVVIADGVTSIGDYTFYYCDAFTSIELPNSVTTIGDYAFFSCDAFTSIVMSDSLETIGEEAFFRCVALTSIDLPDSLTTIGDEAFAACPSLTSVELPSGVTTIGYNPFHECEALKTITVDPANTSFVSEDGVLFNKDKTLLIAYPAGKADASYTIPNTVKTIDGYAFNGVSGVNFHYHGTSLSVGPNNSALTSNLTYRTDENKDHICDICGNEFPCEDTDSNHQCDVCGKWYGTCGENLTWEFNESTGTLTITGIGAMTDYESFSYVPWYAIRTDITKVVIADDVTSIGDNAFYTCSELASIELPNSVTTIGDMAFFYCDALTSIELPNSVTTIGDHAFRMCESIVSISLPDNLTSLGMGVFRQCTSLVEITVGPNNPYFSTEGGVLFNKDKTTLIKYPEAKENNSYAIPSTVTTIAEYAFNECNNLVAVTIPSSVTTIADYAFYNCEGLLEMTVPDSVTSLGSYSFAFCEKLETLRFGTGITEIPKRVAQGCKSLVTVELPDTIKKIGDEAFDGTENLENCIIPDGVTDIGYEVFAGSGLLTIVFPRSLQSVGATVVDSSSKVESIHYCGTEKEWNSKVKVDEDNALLFDMIGSGAYLVDADYDNYCDICGRNCGPVFKIEDNKLYISYDGKTTWEVIGNVADGNSVVSISKTGSAGNVDTYTITYSDGSTSTFTVTNGVDGADGITPQFKVENSILYVSYDEGQTWTSLGSLKGDKGDQGEQGEQGDKGDTGNGIAKIEKTDTNGNVDTYTITYTDGTTTTFTVTNGAQGIQGIQGEKGDKGDAPVITIQNGNWYIDGVDTGVAATGIKGDTGNGISDISKTKTEGLVDTYTITYTDGTTTTFTVTNGEKGDKGDQGEQGIQGIQGVPGKDGHTPVITIQNGNWYIDGVDTGVAATGIKGDTGNGIASIEKTSSEGLVDTYTITYTDGTTTTFTVTNGEKGEQGEQGIQGIQGVPGKDGHTPVITIVDGYWYIDGVNTGVAATGIKGDKGDTGNGIAKIEKTSSDGLVDTYTITYTDGTTTTFTVTNGAQGVQGTQGVPGKDGHTPVITIQNGNWFVDGVDTGVAATGIKGDTGNGIASIRKTGIDGLVDTYTITYTDGTTTTFTVTNGEKGEQGEQGIQGVPGKDGHTPVITIVDGYWYIDGVNTNILAVGAKGEDGKDGVTPQLRINSDNIWEVSYDNGATWESLGISAVGQNGSNGTNGVTPKLRVNSKNIWEVSYDNGATWESLGISAVGTNGTNGANGKDGKDGVDGKDGKDGVDGKDGITPKLRINDDNIWEVSYDNGQTWESLGVAASGADGVTPQLRINGDTNMWEVSYDNGETWTSMGVVATGADGKDGGSILPIIISCISLAGMVIMFCIMMADRKKGAYAGRH